MKRFRASILAISVILISFFSPSAQLTSDIFLVSSKQSGGGATGSSGAPTIAPNGKKLAFRSGGFDIVSSDTNSSDDIFLQDISTGDISRVTVFDRTQCGSSGTVQADDSSTNPSISPISPNGFYVIAFESLATNLSCFTDSGNFRDILLYFPTLNLIERASFPPADTPVESDGDSFSPSVTIIPSPNRVRLVYSSDAENLVTDDGNGFRDIFYMAFDEPTGTTIPNSVRRISRAADPAELPDGNSDKAKISGDGNFVVFESNATNLISGITISDKQIYLVNLSTGETSLISKDSSGAPGDNDSSAPSISFTGRYILYRTRASNIISGADTSKLQVVLHDRTLGTTIIANTTSDGIVSDGSNSINFSGSISPDGRVISFTDDASNLIDNDTNSLQDIYLKDRSTGNIQRTSTGSLGEPDGSSTNAITSRQSYNSSSAFSLFASSAENLVSSDGNGNADIFVNELSLSTPTLIRGTSLEVPPDVELSGASIATVSLQSFSGIASSAIAAARVGAAVRISYEVKLRNERTNDLRRRISRRNEITFRDLRPGNYTVSYRVLAKRGDKVIRKTRFSPSWRFSAT